jgi:hypothetical protein
MLHKIQYFLAGLIIWFRLGIPFKEAMLSAKEAEKITKELDL